MQSQLTIELIKSSQLSVATARLFYMHVMMEKVKGEIKPDRTGSGGYRGVVMVETPSEKVCAHNLFTIHVSDKITNSYA